MIGVIFFWIHYIIAIVLLYNILRCVYIKSEETVPTSHSYIRRYVATENDERLKYPLWIIILLILVLFIPVINIVVYSLRMLSITNEAFGGDERYYCRSFLTKKY